MICSIIALSLASLLPSARLKGLGTGGKKISATLKYSISAYSKSSFRSSMNIYKAVNQHIIYPYNKNSGIQEQNFLNNISRFNFESLSLKISHIFQMKNIVILPRMLPKIVPENQRKPFF